MSADNPRPTPEAPSRRTWRGLAVPITRMDGDYWASTQVLDVVWSSIILILGTQIGTRIMRPEFGSRIPELVFEPNDEVLEALANRYTVDAINRWEPRANIRNLYTRAEESQFTIGMQFIVRTQEGFFNGKLVVYRNQSFKLLEQYWNQIN